MKNSTISNIKSVLAVIKAGPATLTEVIEKTSLNAHQVNALSGIWTNKVEGGVPQLWERREISGHTFLVVSEEGKTWAPPTNEKPAKAPKAPTMDVEAARQALLASLAEAPETASA